MRATFIAIAATSLILASGCTSNEQTAAGQPGGSYGSSYPGSGYGGTNPSTASNAASSPQGTYGSSAAGYGSGGAAAAPPAGTGAMAAPIGAADLNFLAQAAYGGLAEVQVSAMAERNASSPAVREFARAMITDHTRANDELAQLARRLNLTAPTTPDPGRMQAANLLQTLSGPRFDQDYVALQLAEHRAAVALFATEAAGGRDPLLRDFAARHEPTLRQHLAWIETLSRQTVSSAR